MRIALTGGIACGKSMFAKFLRELGIRLLDADDVVHELEAADGAAVPALVARFGPGVLAPDGSVDRPALAARVFSSPSDRRALEGILFPLVRSRLLSFLSPTPPPPAPVPPLPAPRPPLPAPSTKHQAPGTRHQAPSTRHQAPSTPPPAPGTKHQAPRTFSLVVIPLLFESHWEGDYDTIIAITSPPACQIARMMRTRGYTRAHAEARLAAQMPAAEKAARADFVVVNDSTEEHLKQEAGRLVAWLEERAQHEQ